jgi:AraC-like DNA-binding protein
MFDAATDAFELQIPPWPVFMTANYRHFRDDEKHITRICKDFVLLFMLESSLYFSEDGRSVEVDAGSWYIQVPGLKQEGIKGSPAPKYFYIHFQAACEPCDVEDEGESSGTLASNGIPIRFRIPVRGTFRQQHFTPLFNKLVEPLLQPADILRRQVAFFNILYNLICSTRADPSETNDLTFHLMSYLADNFKKPSANLAISEKFHFTSDYLTRRMKHYCGITPYKYMQQIRFEKAKELLANTDYKLSNIAKEVGYNDLTVFYKTFRKLSGVAPGTWRKQNRR